MGAEPASAPRFELVTRRGCHLCDEMREAVAPILAEYGLDLTPVDVDQDATLAERFGDTVPVLLRDGRAVAKVRITARQVHRLVRRRR